MTTQAQINKWAKTLGPALATMKPTADELELLYQYAQQHPGSPSAVLSGILEQHRIDIAHDNMSGSPLLSQTATSKAVASPTAQTANAGGAPNSALAAAGAKLGLSPAQIQAITAGSGSSTSSPALDQFDGTTPVFIQSPVVSAPNANLPAGIRTRLAPGDQLATGTGDTTGGPITSTYQSVLSDMYKMDATDLKALKQQLWAGGFYPAGTDASIVNSAVPDVLTRNAYVTAVQQAARLAEAGHTTTVQQVIALGNPDPQKNTGASANGPYTITNPVDLKQALQSAAQERLGENLSDADIKKFAALYHGMESQASLRQQAAANNNAQTAILAPPSPTASAEDYIQQNFAPQQQSYGAISRQQAFYNLLGPIVSGA